VAGKNYQIIPGANENGIVLVNGAQSVTLVTGTPVNIVAQGTTLVFQYPNLVPVGSVYNGTYYNITNLLPSTAYNAVFGVNENSLNVPPRTTLHASGPFTTYFTAFQPSFYTPFGGVVTGSIYLAATGLALTATIFRCDLAMAGSTVTFSDSNANDANAQIKVTWRDNTDRYTTTSALPLTLTPVDGSGFIEIESVFKPTTQGTIQVTLNNPLSALGLVVASLAPSVLQSPSYQRVRIFPIPASAITLNVLGKKPCTPLVFDTEIPAIRNLDNCLIAFAMGDMFTRARFPAEEAAPHYQEGAMLLKELALLEALQAAHCSMIDPETGFGNGVINPRYGFGRGYL
jgi:hypothetical protein